MRNEAMDVRSWLKDMTKKRDAEDDAPENISLREGWQPAPSNPFENVLGIITRIFFIWLGLQITGLNRVIGLSSNVIFFILGAALLTTCLYYLYPYLQLAANVLFGRPRQSESAPPMPVSYTQADLHTEIANANYDDVYIGDDGELIFRPDATAKSKREGL
jgi:hypothetical protein